jgi:Uri superfamily endonuclease
MDSGRYALLLHVPDELVLDVGGLGRLEFPAGLYGYAGSAARGLRPRLLRHARREKAVHWHIDRLTARDEVRVLGAVVLPLAGPSECEAANGLVRTARGERLHPGFGSSDCGCPGHLVFLGRIEDVPDAIAPLEVLGGHWSEIG